MLQYVVGTVNIVHGTSLLTKRSPRSSESNLLRALILSSPITTLYPSPPRRLPAAPSRVWHSRVAPPASSRVSHVARIEHSTDAASQDQSTQEEFNVVNVGHCIPWQAATLIRFFTVIASP